VGADRHAYAGYFIAAGATEYAKRQVVQRKIGVAVGTHHPGGRRHVAIMQEDEEMSVRTQGTEASGEAIAPPAMAPPKVKD